MNTYEIQVKPDGYYLDGVKIAEESKEMVRARIIADHPHWGSIDHRPEVKVGQTYTIQTDGTFEKRTVWDRTIVAENIKARESGRMSYKFPAKIEYIFHPATMKEDRTLGGKSSVYPNPEDMKDNITSLIQRKDKFNFIDGKWFDKETGDEYYEANGMMWRKSGLKPQSTGAEGEKNYAQRFLDGEVPFDSEQILNSLSFAQVLELIQEIRNKKKELTPPHEEQEEAFIAGYEYYAKEIAETEKFDELSIQCAKELYRKWLTRKTPK